MCVEIAIESLVYPHILRAIGITGKNKRKELLQEAKSGYLSVRDNRYTDLTLRAFDEVI